MPELPEVETIRRALEPHLLQRRICELQISAQPLRYAGEPQELRRNIIGASIMALHRRGKYLLFELDNAAVLLVHLGMSGACRICQAQQPWRKHDHVQICLDDGNCWRLHDPRRFGSVRAYSAAQLPPPPLRHLGCEPLDENAFTAEYIFDHSRKRKAPIKNLLMAQQFVVGVGNIYACEALFKAGIHPQLPAMQLSPKQCQRLSASVRAVLEAALVSGGTSIRDFRHVDGSEGKFALQLKVYNRQGLPCPRCGSSVRIERIVMAGRATYFCPRCQT